jgi:hypothetical protein
MEELFPRRETYADTNTLVKETKQGSEEAGIPSQQTPFLLQTSGSRPNPQE